MLDANTGEPLAKAAKSVLVPLQVVVCLYPAFAACPMGEVGVWVAGWVWVGLGICKYGWARVRACCGCSCVSWCRVSV